VEHSFEPSDEKYPEEHLIHILLFNGLIVPAGYIVQLVE